MADHQQYEQASYDLEGFRKAQVYPRVKGHNKDQDFRRKIGTLRFLGSQPNRVGAKLGPANRTARPGCGFPTC